MEAEAYWIKDNKIIDIKDIKHITFLLKCPQDFGFSKEEIEKLYDRYNEPVGLEGKAREEIIKRAAEKGWIRARHYAGRNDYWTIQFDKFLSRKGAVKKFLAWALNNKIIYPDDTVVLTGYDDGHNQIYNFQNGGIRAFLREYKINSEEIILIDWRKHESITSL